MPSKSSKSKSSKSSKTRKAAKLAAGGAAVAGVGLVARKVYRKRQAKKNLPANMAKLRKLVTGDESSVKKSAKKAAERVALNAEIAKRVAAKKVEKAKATKAAQNVSDALGVDQRRYRAVRITNTRGMRQTVIRRVR